VSKDGHFRNPLREIFPTGHPIEKGEMEAFHRIRDEMTGWLQGDSPNRKRLEDEENKGAEAGE
jgi:hypothetical protein